MRKEVITALPMICKLSYRTKDLVLEENSRLICNDLQKILLKNPSIQLDFITEVKPNDKSLIKEFEKLNKKYTTCCPVENFVYPYIEGYSKSFHNIIPFDTQPKNILEAYHEIRGILNDYNAEYNNRRKKAKLKYKILIRIPETYKFGKIRSI